MNVISVLIILVGIGAILYYIYEGTVSGHVNNFNKAFVDINRFVNRNDESCEEYLNNVAKLYDVNAVIADADGNILLKSKNVEGDKLDVEKIRKWLNREYKDGNVYQVYDITIDGKEEKLYIYKKYNEIDEKKYTDNELLIILLSPVIAAMLLTFFLTSRKVKYIKQIAEGAVEFSNGNLDYRIQKKGMDELGFLAESMNSMAEKLKENIEKERAQEEFKTELITNVSHDLRTPLTSLIAYMQLVGDEKTTEENKKKYTAVSIEKAYKLNKLIEDLFEYSKLESGGISLNKREVNVVEILEQSIGELFGEAQKRNMNLKKEYEASKVILNVDSSKLGRVFENLLSNAVKYGVEGTDIYINLIESSEYITILFKNEVPNDGLEDTLKTF